MSLFAKHKILETNNRPLKVGAQLAAPCAFLTTVAAFRRSLPQIDAAIPRSTDLASCADFGGLGWPSDRQRAIWPRRGPEPDK